MGARLNGHMVVLSERNRGLVDDEAALRSLTEEIANPAFGNLNCLERKTTLEKLAARASNVDYPLALTAAQSLLLQAHDNDPMIRNVAMHETVGLAGKFEKISAFAYLTISMLRNDESEENRILAARHAGSTALVKSRYIAAIFSEILEVMQSDHSARVRQQVLHRMADIGEAMPEGYFTRVVGNLQKALKDSDSSVVTAALHRLAALRARQGLDDEDMRDSLSFGNPSL